MAAGEWWQPLIPVPAAATGRQDSRGRTQRTLLQEKSPPATPRRAAPRQARHTSAADPRPPPCPRRSQPLPTTVAWLLTSSQALEAHQILQTTPKRRDAPPTPHPQPRALRPHPPAMSWSLPPSQVMVTRLWRPTLLMTRLQCQHLPPAAWGRGQGQGQGLDLAP